MSIYTICSLFLQQKTTAIHNILFYVWSIFIVEDPHFAGKCVARDFGGASQIRLHFLFFFGKTLERNITVYHKKVSDYTTFTLVITWSFLGTLIFEQYHF